MSSPQVLGGDSAQETSHIDEIENFVRQTISGKMSVEEQKAFLLDLNKKGFTGIKVAQFVKAFYEEVPVRLELSGAIDICGTGGSGLPRINTSTISTFILSACDIPIAKHGNRAASGRFGSFDLLEELGIDITLNKPQLESIYGKERLAFIFAKQFHPAFRHFAEARQELGVKTIFNILGPLLNPANPDVQVIGCSSNNDMKLIAEASKVLGKKHILVLNGNDGLDELTLTGPTNVMELESGEITSYTLSPEDFGFDAVPFEYIAGGDRAFNIQITEEILNGKCKTHHHNLVLANCALVLKFMGKVASYKEGVDIACHAICSGRANQVLESYRNLSQSSS